MPPPELLLPTSSPLAGSADSTSRRLCLASDEAARRLASEGPNELPHVRGTPLALRFARQFTDLFAVVLQVAAAVTLAAYLAPPHDPGNLQLGAAILGWSSSTPRSASCRSTRLSAPPQRCARSSPRSHGWCATASSPR